jgi:CBS domain-containing protein
VKIDDVMTKDLVTVTPDTPFKDVVDRLVASDVSGVPVVDQSGTLLGIVTEADLVSKAAYGGHRRRALAVLADLLSAREHHWVTKSLGSVAADVMTTNMIVCDPAEDVSVVARRMLGRGVKRVPVVHEGRLVGMVSRKDLLKMFDRPDDEIAADVVKVLTSDQNRPDDCHVSSSVEHGIVTLRGDVRYAWDIPIVLSLVRKIAGLVDIVDHIHNREPNPEPSPPRGFGVR